MASIPLRRRDGSIAAHAVVDPGDLDWLSQWRWRLMVLPSGYRRASRATLVRPRSQGGPLRTIYMARQIMGLEAGDPRQVDHINRDGLDNRRANLRIVDRARQQQNLSPHRGHSSRFRGVSFFRRTGKWHAEVQVRGQRHHLGYFETEEAAGEAARAFRLAHMEAAVD